MDKTSDLVISKGTLKQNQLQGKVAVITGAGGGIGFEAARALVWLGVKVVIAEIDKKIGVEAQRKIETEFGKDVALFIQTDVGNESSIKRLINLTKKKWQKIDIVINNATVATIGAVEKASIDKWDLSYQVNLRGPVLLTRYCLPKMIE
jgi:NAD(P)-dependent dehydrogenase (short-subunit alcohol dehydrogenase family)